MVKKQPVQCVQCQSIAVVLSQAKHPKTKRMHWRFTCLDCRVAWDQEEHGGSPDEYTEA